MAIVSAIAHKVVVEFGLLCNGLLGTTRPKQLERTPTLGLLWRGTLVQAALADFSPTCSGRRARAFVYPLFLYPCA